MHELTFKETTPKDSALTASIMSEYWGGEPLIIRGKEYFPSKLQGILASSEQKLAGFIFYEIQGDSCEIVVLEALDQFKGIGTTLCNKVIEIARAKSCRRVYLMTSNDNLDALRFYQKRGFVICGLHINSMEVSRKLKPGIPMTGDYGIPLRDEIDLEYLL